MLGEQVAYIVYILYSAFQMISAHNEISGCNDQHRSRQTFATISYELIKLKTAECLSACLPLRFLNNRNVNIEPGDVSLRPFNDGPFNDSHCYYCYHKLLLFIKAFAAKCISDLVSETKGKLMEMKEMLWQSFIFQSPS